MNNYSGETVENWKELAIGALIAQAVGGLWLYLRSIGNKVDKTAHSEAIKALNEAHAKEIAGITSRFEKEIEAVQRRLSKWESDSKEFVTREMFRELRKEFHDSIDRVERAVNSQGAQIIALLTKDK